MPFLWRRPKLVLSLIRFFSHVCVARGVLVCIFGYKFLAFEATLIIFNYKKGLYKLSCVRVRSIHRKKEVFFHEEKRVDAPQTQWNSQLTEYASFEARAESYIN